MKRKGSAFGAFLTNRDQLLLAMSAFSFLFFYICLLLIPTDRGDGAALLLGCAMLLSLLMPALFYLRSARMDDAPLLGGLPSLRALWRILIFLLGAFLFGVFCATLMGLPEHEGLFTRFSYPTEFSLISFGSFAVYSFVSVFLPFGPVTAHLMKKGGMLVLLSPVLLYAALAFSPVYLPFLIFFGCLLTYFRVAYDSFLSVFLGNLCFTLGGYGVCVGWFGGEGFLQMKAWLSLLLLALLSLGCFFIAFDFRQAKHIGEKQGSEKGKDVLLWLSVGGATALLSVLLSLFL